MKKNLLFLAILNFSFAFSQCTISGADEVQVGERQIYTAEIMADELENSYEWIYLDQKVIPEGDLLQKSLIVKGSVPGTSVLSLQITKNKDRVKCQKTIKVIAPKSTVFPGEPNCDIKVLSFSETRTSNSSVVFEPDYIDKNYSYKWIVTYRSGRVENSAESKGTFKYANDNVIDKVELHIVAGLCSKNIVKPYETNFWYFF